MCNLPNQFLPQWARPLVLPPLQSPAAGTTLPIQLLPLSHTNIVKTFAQILGLDSAFPPLNMLALPLQGLYIEYLQKHDLSLSSSNGTLRNLRALVLLLRNPLSISLIWYVQTHSTILTQYQSSQILKGSCSNSLL